MAEDGGRGPAFFLSYARKDASYSPELIEDLFRDLSSSVEQSLGPEFAPAFRDTEDLEPGVQWREELQTALSTANAFVALLSPSYFSREYCGKEWAAFKSRTATARRAGKLIQPVLIVPKADLNPLPSVISDAQLTFDGYPHAYTERGLRYLHSQQREAYRGFILELTRVLVSTIRETQLGHTSLPPLNEIQSAFHHADTSLQRVKEASPGPHMFAQFVYVAAKGGELSDLQRDGTTYGDGEEYWQPYQPPADVEVAMIGREIASKERFRYEDVRLGPDFAQRLRDAARGNKLFVVVVDPWTVRLPEYQQLMSELDQINFPGCVVIVSMNQSDPQSLAAASVLEQAIAGTFVNRVATRDPDLALSWVGSADELREQLARALTAAKFRVISRHEIRESARQAGAFQSPPLVSAVMP